MTCIRTGAYVHFVEYGTYAPADLFLVGAAIVIQLPNNVLELMPEMDCTTVRDMFNVRRLPRKPLRTVTHECHIGNGYERPDTRAIVVPVAGGVLEGQITEVSDVRN